jgi:hypothetical protein
LLLIKKSLEVFLRDIPSLPLLFPPEPPDLCRSLKELTRLAKLSLQGASLYIRL